MGVELLKHCLMFYFCVYLCFLQQKKHCKLLYVLVVLVSFVFDFDNALLI